MRAAPLSLDPVDVRDRLVDILREDLIGPVTPDEVLTEAPSRWYLTGFLVPFEGGEAERSDPDSDDDLGDAGGPEGDEGSEPAEASRRKVLLPASIGVSVLVPPGVGSLDVTASWGDYLRVDLPAEGDAPKEKAWRHVPRSRDRSVPVDVEAREPLALPLEDGRAPAAARVRAPRARRPPAARGGGPGRLHPGRRTSRRRRGP
jgi:hypothetical protein